MRVPRYIPAVLQMGAAFLLLALAPRAALGAGQAPLIARSAMLTVEEIRPGMKGFGKSVFSGTRVERFGLTVLGVLRRVDFDSDIILVRIDSGPPVSRDYGVVAGMSGSPIYVDGKLIGALAYAWPFAKRPVAGVTPILQMLEAYRPGSAPVRGRGTLSAGQPFVLDGVRIERAVVAPEPGALPTGQPVTTVGLVPVATPVLVSGVDSGTMGLLRTALEPLGLVPLTGGGAMSDVDARIEPGSAVGARLVGGDLDVTAIGTVTYVKDDVVLAFGHPLSSLGTTEVPLVAAYVHGIMPSASLSLKLASAGQTLGRFTEDRPWCLGGRLGERATMIDTELSVSDRDRGVTREYRVGVVRNRLLTSMLLTGVLAGAIRSVGPPSEGTTRVRFALDAEGLPRLERENTYAIEEGEGLLALLLGPAAAVGSATEELSRILEVLQKSEFGEARLSRLAVEVEVSKRRRIAQLEHVRVDSPIVRPGDEVEVQATIRVANKGRVRRVERIRIPEGCPPGQVRVGIAGGRSAEWLRTRLAISDPRPESMAQMVEQMLQRPSNHELVIQVALPTVGVEARGFVFRDLPPAAIEVLRSAAASRLRTLRDYVEWRSPTEWVISGHTVLTLTVEGDEKDKGGKPPAPEARPSMFEEVGPGLAGLFSTLGLQASAVVGVEGGESEDEEVDLESPPQMPTWEEVEAVGEEEITLGELGEAEPTAAPAAREAIGRLASVWRLAAPKDLTGGRTDGVAVVSTGGLTLGGKASVLGRVDAQCAWPIAVDGEGVVYFGTWTDGCLRRAQADGQTSLVLETEDAGIQAVAAGEDGTIYAAAAPSGRIYRIPRSGEAVELCRLEARNVWALCADERGVLWAATGPEGKVYRVEADGSASVAFQAPDRHVTTLAIGPEETVYLGTSPRGKVYALEPGGGVRSVWEIEKAAAQSIAVDREGNVYLGTSPNGSVFRVSGDGTVRELAKLKAKHVLALHVTADGTLYAAGGPRSKVWVIWPDGTWAELYDPKTMFVAAMAGDRAGALYFTAADTGRVVKLDLASHRRGQFLSPVHDAKATARWGAVRWHGQLPSGTGMRLWTRTGDTAHPDATWSEWELLSGGAMPSVASPPGRFAQCQVELEGSGSARPRVEAVEISYLPANRTPEVSLAAPRGGEFWSGKQSVRWKGRDPDGDRLIYEVFWSADGGGSWHKLDASGGAASEGREAEPQESGGSEAGSPTPQEMSGNGEGLGAATGAGGLSYDGEPLPSTVVGLPAQAEEGESDREVPGGAEPATEVAGVGEGKREDGSQGESAVAAGRSTSLEWDTTEVDDGRYWIKVVGTDRAANPLDPREGETVSYSLIVDNTPPELIRDRRRQDEDPAPETITVFERTSYVTSAEFRLDGGEWLAAAAADDIFDSQLEAIVLDSGRLPAGTHRLEVRARDAAGNSASMELHYKR